MEICCANVAHTFKSFENLFKLPNLPICELMGLSFPSFQLLVLILKIALCLLGEHPSASQNKETDSSKNDQMVPVWN